MLQEAMELQNNAVSSLIDKTFNGRSNVITFKAPTGAGKTFMMADYMNRILSERDDIIFIVSTLSKGKLAEQNYKRFVEYEEKEIFPKLKPTIISTNKVADERLYIPTDCNVYVLPRDLYKVTTDLYKDGAMERFLQGIRPNILNPNGKNIILIKDESHIATNNLDSLAKKYFDKTVNFSATPDPKSIIDVEITEEEAEYCNIIKRVEYIEKEDTNEELENAIDEYIKIKKPYLDLLNINPCIMIQISNQEDGEREKEEIVNILEAKGLNWVALYSIVERDKNGNIKTDKNGKAKTKNVFESNDKINKLKTDKWLDYVKNPLSNIDVLIFKLKVAEGFDIPRACMLYQRRQTQSDQLDKQVVGRIRRNPRLADFEYVQDDQTRKLCTVAYAWGIKPSNDKIIQVRLRDKASTNEEIQIKTTRLKQIKGTANFNVNDILSRSLNEGNLDIFTLYKSYNHSSQAIKEICCEYTTNYQKWIKFTSNMSDITKEYSNIICDYEQSMILAKDENNNDLTVSVPSQSSFVDTEEIRRKNDIRNCFWVRADEKTEFSFDSEAEKRWVDILKDLCSTKIPNTNNNAIKNLNGISDAYLWGKNYLPNSEIKFEYYLHGRHFSYPDFIMKDCYDRIHIFEVKSTNPANIHEFDTVEYKEKIKALHNCYKQASKMTSNIFYIPIYLKNQWTITRYMNGEIEVFNEYTFKQSFLLNE